MGKLARGAPKAIDQVWLAGLDRKLENNFSIKSEKEKGVKFMLGRFGKAFLGGVSEGATYISIIKKHGYTIYVVLNVNAFLLYMFN
ncbi:hypothetical protein [Virgibacillus sp. Bac330]|uniref:hypothetical protein n=1 Tax=Virgibacillus sp. Bac330 TaxID=2419841 RepID=UPI000EF5094D|nr:hypothetical protein [Virgibacillus sp. Bac330]